RLREITLTEIAHLIDRRNRRAEANQYPVSATDRVMVGLSSRSPDAPALLRKAARMADRLNAPWYAVYIQIPAEDITRIDAATQQPPRAGPAARRDPHDVPRRRRGQHDPRLRPRVRDQDHRRRQDPTALVQAARGAVDPRAARAGFRRNRYPDRGRIE